MAEVVPFKGVLYNVPRISKVSGEDLLAPPYDIITHEYQEELYQKSPYNVVRIDFGKEYPEDNDSENKYTRARSFLETWLKEEIMITGTEPCFYAYEVSYYSGGLEKRLRGVLGLVKLEELGKGNIYPHECTHSKPKKDRLSLLRYCDANISPIFSLYNSPEQKTSGILAAVTRDKPYIEARDMDGAVHRLWTIADKEQISVISGELKDKTVFIADGHHRYETALEFQKEKGAGKAPLNSPNPYDYVLMFLANMSDEGLTILPAHRLVRKIPEDALERISSAFSVEAVSGNFDIAETLEGKDHCLGFYRNNDTQWHLLRFREGDLSDIPPAQRTLDVTILHELILKKLLNVNDIAYEMDVDRSLDLVRKNEYEAVFFLNPTKVQEVEEVALASSRMPPKSTYFYPKLLTGLVLNKFNFSFKGGMYVDSCWY
jgi:uncharacterized protein (DUF1015 family)